jgi:hypothetical protein
MQIREYSWEVELEAKRLVVSADEVVTSPAGDLCFYAVTEKSRYLLAAFPCGTWLRVEVLSALTGMPNATELSMVLKGSKWVACEA